MRISSCHRSLALRTASLLLLAVGCHRPLTPIEAFEPGWTTAAATPDPETDGWIDDRADLDPRSVASPGDTERATLEAPALRRLVLERHPGIAAAKAELEAAEARATAAGAWDNPEIEGRYLLAGAGQGELEASLGLTLPISGRIAAARNAAAIERDMAAAALEAARHGALVEVDLLLAELAHRRYHLALAQEVAGSSRQLADLVEQRQAAALVDPLDATIVLAEAARDAGGLARAEAELAAIEGLLLSLVGLEPGRVALHPPALEPGHLSEERDTLLEAAIATRPQWIQARLDLERAEWHAREASRARIPEPSLGPAVVGDPRDPSVGLKLGLPIPILAPGGAPYRAAVAERDAAHERLVAASREAPREIDALLAQLEGLERALHAVTNASLGSARQAAQLAQDRYQAGQLDVLHLQSARRAWADIEAETINILLEIRHTQLELELAVGRPLQLTPTSERP